MPFERKRLGSGDDNGDPTAVEWRRRWRLSLSPSRNTTITCNTPNCKYTSIVLITKTFCQFLFLCITYILFNFSIAYNTMFHVFHS